MYIEPKQHNDRRRHNTVEQNVPEVWVLIGKKMENTDVVDMVNH